MKIRKPMILIACSVLVLILLPGLVAAKDSDGDGMTDSCEYSFPCLQPGIQDGDLDPDSDGLTNYDECFNQINPCVADTDGDTFNDDIEITKGSNPRDSEIYPRDGYGIVTRPVSAGAEYPSLAWSGSEYMVASIPPTPNYYTPVPIYLSRFSSGGTWLGLSEFSSTTEEFRTDLAWSGSEYGLAMALSGASFQRFTASGTAIGNTWGGGNGHQQAVSIVSSGANYGIGYSSPSTFFLVNAAGILVSTVALDPATNYLPVVAWTGSEFGVSWGGFFQRISATGTLIGSKVTLGAVLSDLDWSGNQYGAVWQTGSGVKFCRLSATGVKQGSDVAVSNLVGKPSLAYASGWFVLAGNELVMVASNDSIFGRYPLVSPEKRWEDLSNDITTSSNSRAGVVIEYCSYDLDPEPGPCFHHSEFLVVGHQDDRDGDWLTSQDESRLVTSPNNWDTDGDRLSDSEDCAPRNARTVCTADTDHDDLNASVEAMLGTDPDEDDSDGDGLDDAEEYLLAGTDPTKSDSDDDGIEDREEYNTLGTDPAWWDSDYDTLPDGLEVANLSGHTAELELDPLDSADGSLDFDGDGIDNAHDYWNGFAAGGSGNGIYIPDKVGWSACGYWAEGDGDGFISPADESILQAAINEMPDYSQVYPSTGETQDLDTDTFLSPADSSIISAMINSLDLFPLNSRPAAVARVAPAAGVVMSAAVGDTVSVTVSVSATGAVPASGVPVVFSLDPSSTAAATLLGGEGANGTGRYDLTTSRASGGLARVILRIDSVGTLIVNAKVNECGTGGLGRYCPETVLAEPVWVDVPE